MTFLYGLFKMIIVYTSLFFLLLAVTVSMVLVLKKTEKRPAKFRMYSINAVLFISTLLFSLLIIEVFCYAFIVHSDSFSFTLANQRWFEKYWHPINRLGYRDPDYSTEKLNNSHLIFVVGDSFVAGQGIKNYQDRFSNRLQDKLGADWLVLNIAQVGWSTTDELHALTTHPYKPEILIWSYFVDDIRETANRSHEKFRFTELITLPSPRWQPIIEHSYFINFFYWRWYRQYHQGPESVYWQKLQYFYDHEEIWSIHEQELTAVVQYARERDILLIPLVFPNLVALEQSKPITTKVIKLFQALGTHPLDMTATLRAQPAAELVVNPMDAHPNEKVHTEVATLLFTQINSFINR